MYNLQLVKYTWLSVFISMSFNKRTQLYKHCHDQEIEYFHHFQKFPQAPFQSNPQHHSQSLEATDLIFVLIDYLF